MFAPLEPVCLDPAQAVREERARGEWTARMEAEEWANFATEQPPGFSDLWQCPACDRTFPSPASTERHIEFEHTPDAMAAPC